MKVTLPKTSVAQTTARKIGVGEVKLGPVTVGQLTLRQMQVGLATGTARLSGITVSVGLKFGMAWTFSLKIDGFDLLPSFITRSGHIDLGAMALDVPLPDVALPGLETLAFEVGEASARNVQAVVAPIRKLALGPLLAERIQARGLVAPAAGFQLDGLGLGRLTAEGLALSEATLESASIGRVATGGMPIPSVAIPGLTLPPVSIEPLVIDDIVGVPRTSSHSTGGDNGLLSATLTVEVTAGMHIDQLQLDNLKAQASIGEIRLDQVRLPVEVLDLSLAQIGIRDLVVPKLEVH